jgi:hypothetical protein
MGSGGRPDSEFWSFEEGHGQRSDLVKFGRGLATFVLGGLSSMEIVSLAVLFIGMTGFLWLADVVEPERLVTEATLRSTWAVMVLAIVRPVTWVPYWLLFLGFQALADAAAPRRSVFVRNLAANVGAVASLALTAWVFLVAIPGSSTALLRFLGFLTGTVSLEGLGQATGEWDALRVGAVVVGALLLRILLPPLGRDLDLSAEPILGFVSGGRGRLDRVAVVVAVAGSVALVAIGLAVRATGR